MPDGREKYDTLNIDQFTGLYALKHPSKSEFPENGTSEVRNLLMSRDTLESRPGRKRLNATTVSSRIPFLTQYTSRDNVEHLVFGIENTASVPSALNGTVKGDSGFDPKNPDIDVTSLDTILSAVFAGYYSVLEMDRLLYMSDGLILPKMYDGTSAVNWGIYRPSDAPSAVGTSSGVNTIDLAELIWTADHVILEDCEDAWVSGDTDLILCGTSTDKQVGNASSLVLIGTTVEPLSSNTKLMLHANGTDGDVTFTEASSGARTVTGNANAQLDTAQSKFGTASMLFDGTGDYFSIPYSADFEPGTGDFSVDFWLRMSTAWAGEDCVFDSAKGFGGGSAKGVCLALTGSTGAMRIFINGSSVASRTLTISAGVWYHIALCREGTNLRLFLDGTQQGATITNSTNISGATETFKIGGHDSSTGFTINGWIDEFRFDKGVARFTSTFIPPTIEYGDFEILSVDPTGFIGMAATEDLSAPVDLSGYYGVEFWFKSSKSLAKGDVQFVLCDSTSGALPLEYMDIPTINNDTWTKVTVQFTNPALLTSVASIGLFVTTDKGNNALYIDDVKAIRCKVSLDFDQRTEGATSIKIEVPGNVPNNTLLAYRDFASLDLTGDTVVLLSIRCNKEMGFQDLKYLLDNTSACASPIESIYVTPDLAADTWHHLTLSLATPASLGAIISNGLLISDRTLAPCTIWIDNIRRGSSAAGNLTGRYYSWVSYYSTKYDRESDLSPISNVADLNGQAMSLSGIPTSSDSQVDARRIYRSLAGGTVPHLEATILDNVTTTKVLNMTDAALSQKTRHPSGEAGSGKYNPPLAMPYMVKYKNRILIAGSKTYSRGTVDATNGSATFTFGDGAQVDESFVGRELRLDGQTKKYLIESVNVGANTCVARPPEDLVSGVYTGTTANNSAFEVTGDENLVVTSFIDDDNIPRPHGFPLDESQTVEGGRPGDSINGLALAGDVVLVPKRFSTYILEGDYPPWTLNRISDNIGCVADATIAQDDQGNAIWLAGKTGVALSDGYTVRIITDHLSDIFSGEHELGLNSEMFSQAHAVYNSQEGFYYLFCASADSEENDVVLVLDTTNEDPTTWDWYYYDGIKAASSTIVYDEDGVASVVIGDYQGFISKLGVGYYDSVESGTLTGTPTGSTANTLTDSGASFYSTGSKLLGVTVIVKNNTTGVIQKRIISSNTGTQLTVTSNWDENPGTGHTYYIGAYEFFWKSKQYPAPRPTDKNLLIDGVIYYGSLTAAPKMKARILKNLGATEIANQQIDMNSNEEAVLLVRERVSHSQWELSGIVHGQKVVIQNLGLRFRKHSVK